MKRLAIAAISLTCVGLLTTPAIGAGGQVSICHATASASNPFVLIHPAAAGIVNGHLGHQDGADVVPPFTYKGITYSQNWDAPGQALFANGCAAPTAPPDDGGGYF